METGWGRAVLAGAALWGCASRVKAEQVMLVEAGRPRAAIVLDAERPTRAAHFAACELQHVVRLITGAELPIVRSAEAVAGTPIFVGESRATRRLGYPDKPFEREEYLMAVERGRIVLMGHDSPDTNAVDYANEKTFPETAYVLRSTTYAVYDFLEQCCGVRFYSFGDDGIAFDRRETLTVAPAVRRASPAMDAFRHPYFSSKAAARWSARDIRLLLLRWRVNTLFGACNHSVYSVYWRYWDRAVSPALAKLFIEKRTNYFAQGYAGKYAANDIRRQYPDDPDLPPQLCPSDSGPVDYFADEARRVFQGETVPGGYGNDAKRMPGFPWFFPMQEQDSGQWCQCGRCKSLFTDVPKNQWYNYVHFDWVNRIAGAAASHDPRIGIATLAYSDTLNYPDPAVIQLRTNVAVQLCLGIQSWYHPRIYERQHGAYKTWVAHEAARRPLTVWLYLLCPSHEARIIYKYNQFFPVLYPWQAGRHFSEFVRDGIRGYFAEIDPFFHLPEAYVINRLSFDPSADADAVVDEYFDRYYGTAGEPMRRFHREIEAITWNITNYPASTLVSFPKSSFTYGIHPEKVNWHLGTPERIARLQAHIDEAVRTAATPAERRRVQAFVETVWKQAVEGRRAFEAREKVRDVPVPRVTCDHAGNAGGRLERVDFGSAAPSGGWTTLDGSPLQTRPRLTFASDDTHIYFEYRESRDTVTNHPTAGLWGNNLEIFLAAQPDVPYGQLVLSPTGEMTALRHDVIEGVLRTTPWALKPVIRNRLDETGWAIAVAIPLDRLLPDRPLSPGDRLYANIMRTRQYGGAQSWAWSPIFASGYAQSLYRMGTIWLAPASLRGAVEVNGALVSADGRLPDGWTLNRAKGLEADERLEVAGGVFRLASGTRGLAVYRGAIVPVRRGDRIELTFSASGTGRAAAGVYLYAGGGDGAGSRIEAFGLTPGTATRTVTVTAQPANPERWVSGFRPVLMAEPGSTVSFTRLDVRIVPRESAPK
ncbi:MAG: DUF4838 domain-containing protein [Kiritimatiellae bacterium]|nr:DUF4838 domain-containing protein [Kiritimatiellia bacterium]